MILEFCADKPLQKVTQYGRQNCDYGDISAPDLAAREQTEGEESEDRTIGVARNLENKVDNTTLAQEIKEHNHRSHHHSHNRVGVAAQAGELLLVKIFSAIENVYRYGGR